MKSLTLNFSFSAATHGRNALFRTIQDRSKKNVRFPTNCPRCKYPKQVRFALKDMLHNSVVLVKINHTACGEQWRVECQFAATFVIEVWQDEPKPTKQFTDSKTLPLTSFKLVPSFQIGFNIIGMKMKFSHFWKLCNVVSRIEFVYCCLRYMQKTVLIDFAPRTNHSIF